MKSDKILKSGEPPVPSYSPINEIDTDPLKKMAVSPQQGGQAAAHWFNGGGRLLYAEELDGRWVHVEYVFPLDGRLYELRWSEGRPTRLWSMSRSCKAFEFETLYSNHRQRELIFPVQEVQHMEIVMQDVPHSLWSRTIKLALEAHFVEKPFKQRASEPRKSRRCVERKS